MGTLNTIVDAATGGTYGPVEFGADLLGAAPVVLPWVGGGVAGGVALMLVFLGIRKGLGFFRGLGK